MRHGKEPCEPFYVMQAGSSCYRPLVAGKEIAGIDFGSDVLEFGACAVGEDGLGEAFEFGKVVDHAAAEEGGSIFKCGFVDDDSRTFRLDAFHNALDAALTEVVRV